MNRRQALILTATHLSVAAGGFALGIYALPILIAPAGPSAAELTAASAGMQFTGLFRRDLKDSDAFHWGEGTVTVGASAIALTGKLAPGPDYKLYLAPEFLETEDDFKRMKSRMALVGDVKTFDNFLVAMPRNVNPASYTTVVVWCETFSQFITAAKYR